MCLGLGLRHSLPWTAIVDMLEMINCLFGQEVVKATKYFFWKYMEAGKGRVLYHWYCHYCHRFLESKKDLSEAFSDCRCGKAASEVRKAKSFFITLSLEDQIRELLHNQEIVEALQHRFQREKINEDGIEDIYDGELYKALSQPGEILSKWYNLSYTFNTDGFPVGGKSGKQTCWPIYLQLNELPHKQRSKHMLLAGIYVGKKDPNMQLYLFPFVEEANDLATAGVNWLLDKKTINTKVIPLCACVDTPARSKILNMAAFSGYYGCTICPTNPVDTPSGVRYILPVNAMLERTHREILVDAAHAQANKTTIRNKKKWSVRGVKGPTPLHNLKFFDLVKGVRPDIMHSILLGNGRQHFQVLHGRTGKPEYIGSDVRMAAISKRLLTIKPLSSFPRMPREVERYLSWKAKGWLLWLLFYVIPCLLNIIPKQYVQHINLLSSALHIMLKKSITKTELESAHLLVLRYVYLFQNYFGREEMVINLHLLLHMKKSILYLGPAWTHMAFGFEGANKNLLEMKKGTSTIAQEITTKFLTFKALPHLCDKYASSERTVQFCQKLSGKRLKYFSRVGDVILLGKGRVEYLTDEEVEVLSDLIHVGHSEVLAYDKVIIDGIRYAVASLAKTLNRDDSCILFGGLNKMARIHKIVKVTAGIFLFAHLILARPHPILEEDEFGKNSPLKIYEGTSVLYSIRPDEVSGQCVLIDVGESDMYICEVPYGCYGDS